jgi:phosphatidate cytidylyltransferase
MAAMHPGHGREHKSFASLPFVVLRVWRDLGIRVASALVLAPVSLAAIWWGGLFWGAWLSVLALGMGAEWAGLCGKRARSEEGAAIPAGLLLAGLATAFVSPAAGAVVLLGAGILLSLATRRAALGLGILYLGPAYLALFVMRNQPAGLRNVLFVMAVVWAGDIGAYLFGRLVGGPRLAPKISPGKTWAGAAGGTGAAILAGIGAGFEHPARAAALAFVLSLVAQAGDLLESAIKRHFGAKDSGWIIPGHGGLLDRLDGVLAASPVALLWSFVNGPHATMWN